MTPQLSSKQGQSQYLSCRSWLKSGLGWHWLASWEAEAGVVRLRAGGSTAVGPLNWGAKLPTKWPLPCICELLIGLGPCCIIFMRKVKFRVTAGVISPGTPSPASFASALGLLSNSGPIIYWILLLLWLSSPLDCKHLKEFWILGPRTVPGLQQASQTCVEPDNSIFLLYKFHAGTPGLPLLQSFCTGQPPLNNALSPDPDAPHPLIPSGLSSSITFSVRPPLAT